MDCRSNDPCPCQSRPSDGSTSTTQRIALKAGPMSQRLAHEPGAWRNTRAKSGAFAEAGDALEIDVGHSPPPILGLKPPGPQANRFLPLQSPAHYIILQAGRTGGAALV